MKNKISIIDMEKKVLAGTELLCSSGYVRNSSSSRAIISQGLRNTLIKKAPIKIVAHWGVGPWATVGKPEREAITFVHEFTKELNSIWDLRTNLLFFITDTHARLNKFSEKKIITYCESSKALLESRGILSIKMSDFLAKLKLWEEVSSIIEVGPLPELQRLIKPGKLNELKRLAKMHTHRQNQQEAAERYFVTNLIESAAIATEYPNAFFLTHSSPGMSFLLPLTLPIIHIWSRRTGDTKRPWFVRRNNG